MSKRGEKFLGKWSHCIDTSQWSYVDINEMYLTTRRHSKMRVHMYVCLELGNSRDLGPRFRLDDTTEKAKSDLHTLTS